MTASFMKQVYLRALWVSLVVLAALALSGCGGGGGGSGGATGADAPQKSGTDAGYSTHTVSSQQFSLAVPTGWKTASVDKVLNDAAIDQMTANNPSLGSAIKELGKPSSFIKFLAFDPETKNNFATNVNVGVTDVPSGVTAQQFYDANLAQIEQVFGIATPANEEVTLPAGPALRLNYEQEGPPKIATQQYLVLGDGKGYILTFTTLPELTSEYAPIFERAARSFKFD
jgi:hypothetical protein